MRGGDLVGGQKVGTRTPYDCVFRWAVTWERRKWEGLRAAMGTSMVVCSDGQ